MRMRPRACLPFVVLALAACGPTPGSLGGRASAAWSHRYTLADGGEFQIVGGSGTIDVQGGAGPDIEVTAEIGRAHV